VGQLRYVATDGAPRAIGPYSQGVIANGFVYTAGQIALDPATMELAPGGVREQTERVLANLDAVLKAAGSSLGRVVKTTCYLADIGDFAAFNEVYAKWFGDHKPARSTVAARTLPKHALVEIDIVALVGE
jgi:2-iminobutanoate/2-iminopropanoate deaminase